VIQHTEYLDNKANEYMTAKAMIEDLKHKYSDIGLETQYALIQEMLVTKDFAVDKPFLEERIAQTSFYLQQAIEELMKPKVRPLNSTPINKPPVLSSHHAEAPVQITTPQGVDKKIHFPTSSNKKSSILKVPKHKDAPISDRSYQQQDTEIPKIQKESAKRSSMEEYKSQKGINQNRQNEKQASIQHEMELLNLYQKSISNKESLPEVREEDLRSIKSSSASENGRKTPDNIIRLQKPALDVFLNGKIRNPAVLSMKFLDLGMDIVPTCVAFISDSDVVVGTAGSGILISDFGVKCWIKLPNSAPIIGMKSLGRLVACCLDSPTDNLCLIDVEHSDDMMFLKGHSRGVTDVTWTSSAEHFVSVGKDGKLVFWKWDPLTQLKSLKVSNLPLNSVTSLAKSKLIVTGGDDSTIKVFCISGDSIAYRNSIQDTAPVTKVDSFYQNTKFVSSTNLLGEVKIWDISTGE
jgi:WD40 repeat protein